MESIHGKRWAPLDISSGGWTRRSAYIVRFLIKEHSMPGETWTDGEKKIARRVFEAALHRELAEVMAEFKFRAAGAKEPEDMWAVQEYIAQARRDIDSKYDYRYS